MGLVPLFRNVMLWFVIKVNTDNNILKVDFVNKKRVYNRNSTPNCKLIQVDFAARKKTNVLPFPPNIA